MILTGMAIRTLTTYSSYATTVIHCPTRESAIKFIRYLNVFKETWATTTRWEFFKKNTCYNLHNKVVCDLWTAKNAGCEILSVEEVLPYDFEPGEKITDKKMDALRKKEDNECLQFFFACTNMEQVSYVLEYRGRLRDIDNVRHLLEENPFILIPLTDGSGTRARRGVCDLEQGFFPDNSYILFLEDCRFPSMDSKEDNILRVEPKFRAALEKDFGIDCGEYQSDERDEFKRKYSLEKLSNDKGIIYFTDNKKGKRYTYHWNEETNWVKGFKGWFKRYF